MRKTCAASGVGSDGRVDVPALDGMTRFIVEGADAGERAAGA
jgi:hypothetical protein